MMDAEKLKTILKRHVKWLNNEDGGIRADLSYADLSRANLIDANLSGANLRWADLSYADLSGADLSGATLSGATLSGATLSRANLSDASLYYANLSGANLSRADLCGADLSYADLSGADLSGANLVSNIDFIASHFERTEAGYIAYKTFDSQYTHPEKWEIKVGSVIKETVNYNRTDLCGCGINVAPLEWVRKNYAGLIWKVLIRWEWLSGVCCPYNSDGKIRCERVELVEVVEGEGEYHV